MNPQILLQELQTIKQNLRVLIEKIINVDQWEAKPVVTEEMMNFDVCTGLRQ